MHILIVDDEMLARQRLSKLLSRIDGVEVIGEADNGEKALQAVQALDPDLVFMDVKMPGINGLSAAKSISALDEPPAIIFCTAYDEFALDAFDTQAVGYIVKPVHEDQLTQVLEKALRVNKLQRSVVTGKTPAKPQKRQNIPAKTRTGIELIPLADVHCFIADQKYVTVVHCHGETLIDDTLKELEAEFAGDFVRVHRNALVARRQIVGLQKAPEGHHEIVLRDTESRPMVSRRHLSQVKSLISSL